ncbi:ribonuclease I [Terriglobus roseus DSM 18391]|uniref:Ribonuclease I n=1 Tax=Terriglobus roseus (strain DSM 18391 / NRRL B-41598 / KBS 63) TaxID=926566 RepID=I3ZLH0_TERRK|nr:ribonuclease T2 [Terriglobus roseus]AFL90088.1 ribonuclease I [Terriglobus roseus DSM 18391]
MNRLTATFVLVTLTLFVSGCRSAQQTQVSIGGRASDRDDQYNDRYQAESRHRHHHGRSGEAKDDNWESYDREDATAEAPASDRRTAPQPRSDRHHNSHALTAAPGQFDFYLLNLSWSPEFCHTHPAAAECAQHRAFTLHGLWPQNHDGTYPGDCSEAPGPNAPSQYADIYPDASLLQHEWQTHGTCSGLPADQFLTLARRAERSIQIPAELGGLTESTALAPEQIISLFRQSNPSLPAGSIALTCGNNYLTAVEVCMDKNLKAQSCSAVRTCGATQIRIPAPQ